MLELSEVKNDVTWDQAMGYARELGEGWRLPTKEELQIIQASPRSKEFATIGWFWSSSAYTHYSNSEWSVDFYGGEVSGCAKSYSGVARCIRGSFEDFLTWCFGNNNQNVEKAYLYKSSGVDIGAGDSFVDQIAPLIKSTNRPEVIGSIGGFSGLFSLSTKYKDPVLVSSTDGVGTKLKIAQILGIHKTIGIDLVAMCVNDIIVCGAEPLFFLDYLATGKLNIEQSTDVVMGIIDGCRQSKCALLGGETAEMPGFYQHGTYDLAGFSVGVVERANLLGSHKVKSGDVILGLASSGVHSNGFSLINKLVEEQKIDLSKTYGWATILGEALLTPTRIYVKMILDLVSQIEVHALAHITGSGIFGNIPRVIPDWLAMDINKKSWPVPDIFSVIQKSGNISEDEMFNVFNMGIGMAVILPPESLSNAISVACSHYIPSFQIGTIVEK
jgi:phosphoribosylformylglycinamidine cyclo-ligase